MSTSGANYIGGDVPRRKTKTKKIEMARPAIEPGPLAHQPFTILKHIKPKDKKPPPEPDPEPIAPMDFDDDDDLFEAAMAGVTPITWDKIRITRPGRTNGRSMIRRAPTEDEDAITYLEDLIAGRIQFDIKDTDEYLEGSVRGLNPLIVEKLRKGLYSVQAYLDLHGLTVREASEEVRRFIMESSALGYRCVLLIHGRGLNSKDNIPVLKKKLDVILLRGPTRKKILAFTSARPVDGGAGASYVLIRAKQ